MSNLIETYTDAPEAYDGFGTRTVAHVRRHTRRGGVRLVATPAEHVSWQRLRYGSGLHLAVEPDRWDDLRDLVSFPGEAV